MKTQNEKEIDMLFWSLIIVGIFVLVEILLPIFGDFFSETLFLLLIFIFSLLGVLLIIFTLKGNEKGKSRAFFIITGASAIGFIVGVFLHNLLYALGTLTDNAVLFNLLEILHASFFIVAVIICPVGFLVGVIGTIYLKWNKRSVKNIKRIS